MTDFATAQAGVRALLMGIGENPDRPGLHDTPRRVAKALIDFTSPTGPGPEDLLSVTFDDASPAPDQMITVGPIEFASLCLPSKQIVSTVDGYKRARDVKVGDQLWTLHEGSAVHTTVASVASRETRELVEVETDKGTFQCTPDHPFATPNGWVEAKDLAGTRIEWTAPRSLHRNRYAPKIGYHFGYVIGAVFSDGTTSKRYVSLVVNEKDFALKFADALLVAFGIGATVEAVSRPSGFTGRDTPGFRVRVVSSYLADLMRMYAGGDAHHMRQDFPRVAMASEETFRGFLDGYIDGDGSRSKYGSVIISGNLPFLQSLGSIVGNTPRRATHAHALYVADSWMRKHGFNAEDHRTTLVESSWVQVRRVSALKAEGSRPYTVYSWQCAPYPTFLVGGHLSHNCEHHLLPFTGHAYVAYIPGTRGAVVGLSKLARLVDWYAHSLQIQERLTAQITSAIDKYMDVLGSACTIHSTHTCMTSRGAHKPGAIMRTTSLTGPFRDQDATRAEFLAHTRCC